MDPERALVVLFCIATAVAIAVRRIRVPYTVALVVVGLGLGALGLVAPPHLTREMLFTFFLPGLLFEAAFHLDVVTLRGLWRSVSLLAVPGVVLTIVITAAIVAGAFSALGYSWSSAWQIGIVFGSVIAATDPVAVTALFREVGAPTRLATVVEAESLFNDGTGIVMLTLILSLVGGHGSGLATVVPLFVAEVGGGLAIGWLIGFVITRVVRVVDDAMIEIALTMIAAFGSFVLADAVGASGVLATVTAGLFCSHAGRNAGMSDASTLATETFWRYAAFALNSIIFLLIGFEVRLPLLARLWPEIAVGFVAMVMSRAGIVGLLALLQRQGREAMPGSWSVVLVWGGLRGALSIVLALSLPADLDGRAQLVAMTVGAVAGSLLVQGLTLPYLIRALRIGNPTPCTSN